MRSAQNLNHFVWHDCLTPDIDQAINFFTPLVSWNVLDQTSPNIGRYPIISSKNGPIAGILQMPKFLQTSGVPPYWTGYVDTNVEVAEELVPKLGGNLFTLPTTSPMGTSFVFTDPAGAVLSAYEPSESFAVRQPARQSEFVWQRLYSADNEKSKKFYGALFEWQQPTINGPLLSKTGELIGDMGGKPSWVEADTWVYFLGVHNLSETTATLASSAGDLIEETTIQGQRAIVAKDSQGAVVGFTEFCNHA